MPDDDQLIELLVEWEDLRLQGKEACAEELAADSPTLLAALQQRIADLRRMDGLIENAEIGHYPAVVQRDEIPSRIGGYEVMEELGHGGMGVVKARIWGDGV